MDGAFAGPEGIQLKDVLDIEEQGFVGSGQDALLRYWRSEGLEKGHGYLKWKYEVGFQLCEETNIRRFVLPVCSIRWKN